MKKSILILALAMMCQFTTAKNFDNRRLGGDKQPRSERTKQNGAGEKTMPKISQEQMNSFTAKTFKTNGILLNYRESRLSFNESEKPALVIYIHGASGRGNDNTSQMRQFGIYSVYDYIRDNKVNAYYAVPQCPKENTWAGGREGASYVQNIKPLVDYYIKEKNVDPNRIYLFAVSMGGRGAWKLISDNPSTFAACLIASGASSGDVAKNIAKTPVYSTLGSLEGSDKGKQYQQFSEKLVKLGGDAKFDLLDGLDHPDACVQAFSNERITWVFSHKKK